MVRDPLANVSDVSLPDAAGGSAELPMIADQGEVLVVYFGGVLVDEQINLIIAFLRGVDPSEIGSTTTTTVPDSGTDTTQPADSEGDSEMLALGKEVFEVGIGNKACAECHGMDGAGTGEGPNIIGVSKSSISTALGGGVLDMDDINLTSEQLEAVYQYLRTLSS